MDSFSFELISLSNEIFWLILAVVFAIVEVMTLGITSIWFAIGAIVALILAAFNVPMVIQVLVFLASSIILLVYTKPLAKKRLKIGKEKTNYEAIIGTKGVVIEQIDNLSARGQIRISGQIWSARSESGKVIERGEEVTVVDVRGVKAIVDKIDNNSEDE